MDEPGGEVSGDAIDWASRFGEIGAELAAVELALVRLDDGTYGVCEVCAARIDDGVLADAPTTTRCPVHA